MAAKTTFDINNWAPITLGPSWSVDEDGDFIMPERTLGWEIAAWAATWLTNEDGDPWIFTDEQFRFVCWLYALDESGRFIYTDSLLQRLKGWGKDPLAAVLCIVELVGPCRFSHWDADGNPVGKDNPVAHVQLAAVSKDQNENTMNLIPALIPRRTKLQFDIDLGLEKIRAMGNTRKLDIITSSYRSQEGARPTFVLMNEALALDTPIPTPRGWTTMGQLQDGDQVFDEHGKPCTVTAAHPVQEGRRSFRVTFGEGDSVVASDGHWWKVRVGKNPKCTLHEKTTLEMFEAGREFYLPEMHKDIDYPEADLPIDPYLLGLWLGDGASRQAVIACDEQDVEHVIAAASAAGVLNAHQEGPHHVRLANGSQTAPGAKGAGFQGNLRALGLLQNKHIPPAYLSASREQRLALLQGLMDSDGSIRPGGEARFNNADVSLIDGVRELLVSVGYRVNQAKYQTRGHVASQAHWQPMGYLSFIAYDSAPVFRLPRKAERMRSGPRPAYGRKIAKIEEIESVPVRCISVDSESRLFLCGRGLHPTRNTHHWISANGGHNLHKVIARNKAKIKGGQARTLQITNAYLPGEDSIAERTRVEYEDSLAPDPMTGQPLATMADFLYDTLEAPSNAPLDPAIAWEIVKVIRGDAVWLDEKSIISFISRKKSNTEAESRRFWYNQITADEETLVPPKIWDPQGRGTDWAKAEDGRTPWELRKGDEIVLGFDGGRTHDATALIAIRISDQFIVPLGIWFDGWNGPKITGKKDERGYFRKWEVPYTEVDTALEAAFAKYHVRAFFADYYPWQSYVDMWSNRYRDRLLVKASSDHAVKFNMAANTNQEAIVHANERLVMGLADGTFFHDGNLVFKRHVMNTRKRNTQWGMGYTKDSRESDNHNDAWSASLLAFLALSKYLESGKRPKPQHNGRVHMSGSAGKFLNPQASGILATVFR